MSAKPSNKLHFSPAKNFLRVSVVVLLIILQVWWITFMIKVMESRHPVISTIIGYCAFALTVYIYCRNINSTMKLSWILLISAFPMVGAVLYFLAGRKNVTAKMERLFEASERKYRSLGLPDSAPMEALAAVDERLAGTAAYLSGCAGSPLWDNTEVTYYGDALDGLNAQIEALKAAKHFIFMEYLTIEDAECFDQIGQLLKQKAAEGVRVRLIYDDVGCVLSVNRDFQKEMEANGIECRIFNPMAPILNVFMNNRDHRKIMVIDGVVGFTGGYNIARQYFHINHPSRGIAAVQIVLKEFPASTLLL